MNHVYPKGIQILLAGSAALALTACQSDTAPAPGTVQITFYAHETEDGVCEPRRVARVNVPETDLYAVYGDVQFVDTRGQGMTRLPLQYVFNGYDDSGIAVSEARTGLNTDTACADLRIDNMIDHCLLNADRHAEAPCPTLEYSGEGFHSINLTQDRSQPGTPPGDG
jgi:hypothetical protein